jgi:hypothetical protein
MLFGSQVPGAVSFFSNRLMRAQCVEVNAPLLNQCPCFAQALEQLTIEPLSH